MNLALFVHAATTLAMAGLIWFVQVVHYPLFATVGREGFSVYEQAHTRLTARVVAPLMLAEAASALWLAWSPPPGVPPALPIAGLILLAGIWISTFLLQVPRHRRLASGFSGPDHRSLVRSNWIRTVLWTARGCLALWLLRAA